MLQHDRVNIGAFPTPITRESNLAETELEGKVNLFLKHEGRNNDEIGVGIKIRQVEYLFAAAREQGYMHLIVDGVIDSHCCTAISHYAPRYGLQAVLVIKDEKPEVIPATHQKMIDSQADIYYIGKNPEPEKLEEIKQKIASKYKSRGAKPLIVPTGATSELTIPGGIDITKEIADYEAEHRDKFDYVVLPVGTGGIYFGLEIGRRILEKDWKVLGIIIDDNLPDYYRKRFQELGNKFAKMTGLDKTLLFESLLLHEHRGKGYGVFEEEDLVDIERINQQHGMYFDPVYMYKCFKGLKQLIKERQIKPNTDVLLIHTANK